MSWEFAAVLGAGHQAALETGKPLIYVSPPAGWAVAPLVDAVPFAGDARPDTVVLAPGRGAAADLAAVIARTLRHRPVHVLTGRTRTGALLRTGAVTTLVATPCDALDLVRDAALKLETLPRILVAWPESIAATGGDDALDTLLAEAVGAQRLIVTADEAGSGAFLERHAHRAAVAVASRPPDTRFGLLRYASVGQGSRVAAVRDLLDALTPRSTLLWDPSPTDCWAAILADPSVVRAGEGSPPGNVALAIATDLPSAEILGRLDAAARETVVLVRADQLPYLSRLADPLRPVRLTGAVAGARDRAFHVRQRIRERLAQGALDAELLALEPLFAEYDPALVAAAAAASGDREGAAAATEPPDTPSWVRLHVDMGRRDQLRPADLVGALVNGVGIAKSDIGKIEIRDRFCLLAIRPDAAAAAVRGLAGTTLRGRRASVRIDRATGSARP